MQTEQIITALHNAKLYEAAKLQCDNANIDKLSMIIAVATGNVATYKVLYDMFCQLQSGSQTYNIIWKIIWNTCSIGSQTLSLCH